ncbi:MAG: cytidine deaminase [Candidatus Edwardsbacteria bacterium]|jgi:cytidine deaminase|nr:cytidine deaminase [Candidatus Edwardsbacteria bacterium]
MKKSDIGRLVAAARAAQARAYAPYSRFPVGAALLAGDGTVHTGCNVENASYGLSCCAERNAVAAAVLAGKRRFTAIAVAGNSQEPLAPCGACRQVLREFSPGIRVIMADRAGRTRTATLGRLLANSFGPRSLAKVNNRSQR